MQYVMSVKWIVGAEVLSWCWWISRYYRTTLVAIDGSLMTKTYIDKVLKPLIPLFLCQHSNFNLFQQDNACPLSGKLI